MKFKIDWQRMKSDPLHLLWVVGYCIAGGIPFILLVNALGSDSIYMWSLEPVPSVAGGMRIAEGIERFRGHPVVHSWNLGHTLILLSTIFFYIILLPLFIWAMNKRARWREIPQSRFPLKIVVFLGLTGWHVFVTVAYSILGPIATTLVFRSLRQVQTVQSNKDVLINDLNFLALKAQSFYFVPTKEGGGGGRWLNIQRKSNQALTLQEIEHHEPILGWIYGDAFPQKPSKFVLEVFTEDSLAIWGIGSERGDNTTFVNKDGQHGKLELQMIVTPKKLYTNERNTN